MRTTQKKEKYEEGQEKYMVSAMPSHRMLPLLNMFNYCDDCVRINFSQPLNDTAGPANDDLVDVGSVAKSKMEARIVLG